MPVRVWRFKSSPAHAHLDHIGRIPRLVQKGFREGIISTAATRDLTRLILEDVLSLAKQEDRALFDEKNMHDTFSLWELGRVFVVHGERAQTMHLAQ